MKIQISDNLIKHYLRNVYFINGHSCAGKSTAVKMLAERYGMIECNENYHDLFPRYKLDRWKQPALSYFDTMSGWQEWLSMTPEEHHNWMEAISRECIEVEILELLRLSANGERIIVDTNIPPHVLHCISDYHHVAIMLSDPPDICKTKFFDRDDPEKQFMLAEIKKCPDPDATLANFNSWLDYRSENETDFAHCGFFTLMRSDFENDTREQVIQTLAAHFSLGQSPLDTAR